MTRTRWIVVGVALVVVVAWGGVAIALFANPTVDDPGRADAIVMLAGGGDRLRKAIQLADSGVADTVLLASAWVPPVWSASPCNSGPSPLPDDVRILCFEPDPSTTRGEVRFVSDLAESEGWARLVVVASTDQVTRARMLMERCWDGDVAFVGVEHSQPFPLRAVYESIAMVKALVNTGC